MANVGGDAGVRVLGCLCEVTAGNFQMVGQGGDTCEYLSIIYLSIYHLPIIWLLISCLSVSNHLSICLLSVNHLLFIYHLLICLSINNLSSVYLLFICLSSVCLPVINKLFSERQRM